MRLRLKRKAPSLFYNKYLQDFPSSAQTKDSNLFKTFQQPLHHQTIKMAGLLGGGGGQQGNCGGGLLGGYVCSMFLFRLHDTN